MRFMHATHISACCMEELILTIQNLGQVLGDNIFKKLVHHGITSTGFSGSRGSYNQIIWFLVEIMQAVDTLFVFNSFRHIHCEEINVRCTICYHRLDPISTLLRAYCSCTTGTWYSTLHYNEVCSSKSNIVKAIQRKIPLSSLGGGVKNEKS